MRQAAIRVVRGIHFALLLYFVVATGASATTILFSYPRLATANFLAMLISSLSYLFMRGKCILTDIENRLRRLKRDRLFVHDIFRRKLKIKVSARLIKLSFILFYSINFVAYAIFLLF